jgi:flavin-dependent dehydrogenase
MTANGTTNGNTYDVVVIGGGPAGSTIATLLARGGLRVAVFERKCVPRFHVGEALLPANLPIFDRLGCHDALRQGGFLIKPGATLCDEYEGRGCKSFTFRPTLFQPAFSYNVPRAQFDDLLLQHAAGAGATVYRQHVVKHAQIDPDKVIVQMLEPHGRAREVRASLLVDASGRAAFLGTSLGKREPLPDLGKVAIFAHFRGMQREPSIPEGNTRIHLVRDGWLWWIPLADGTDSIGCVLHAQVVKARRGSIEALYEEVLATSPRITAGLVNAQRTTPIHTAANFSYRISPFIGDRHVAIGDALGFVDPIFSAGVLVAMRSAEWAADAILHAFHCQDFSARRFRHYATQLRRGMAPFLSLVRRFYEPAFLDLIFTPTPPLRFDQPILWVLSGAAVDHRPLWLRIGLALFFAVVGIRKAIRRVTGLPTESRWHW